MNGSEQTLNSLKVFGGIRISKQLVSG